MTQTWLLHPSFVRDSMAMETRTDLAVCHFVFTLGNKQRQNSTRRRS